MNRMNIVFAVMSISCLMQADASNAIPARASIPFFDSVPFFNRIPVIPHGMHVASEFLGKNKNIIVGGLIVTAAGIVALRRMTCSQDVSVDATTRQVLDRYKVYQQCKNFIGSDNIQEVKARSIMTNLFDDHYVSRKEVYNKVAGDLRVVENLDSWDLWFRAKCNPQLLATQNAVQERTAEIQQMLIFLKSQEIYLQGQDLHAESHALLTKFAPNYAGTSYIEQRNVIKASKKDLQFQTALNNSIEDANAFGGSEQKPAYACREALWQKLIAIEAVKKQIPVRQYPSSVDDLKEMQNYLILWRGAIEELPEYKKQRPSTSEEAKVEREADCEKRALEIVAQTNAKLTDIAGLKATTEQRAQEHAIRLHEIELRQERDHCSEAEAAQRIDRERLIWTIATKTSALVSSVAITMHNFAMWFINGRNRAAQMKAQVEIAKQNREAEAYKLERKQLALKRVHEFREARKRRGGNEGLLLSEIEYGQNF